MKVIHSTCGPHKKWHKF